MLNACFLFLFTDIRFCGVVFLVGFCLFVLFSFFPQRFLALMVKTTRTYLLRQTSVQNHAHSCMVMYPSHPVQRTALEVNTSSAKGNE